MQPKANKINDGYLHLLLMVLDSKQPLLDHRSYSREGKKISVMPKARAPLSKGTGCRKIENSPP